MYIRVKMEHRAGRLLEQAMNTDVPVQMDGWVSTVPRGVMY